MFAIIGDGGRQYCVREGETIDIDLRPGVEAGSIIAFEKILLANGGGKSTLGLPLIDGGKVEAKVVTPIRKGQKLEIGKFRRRKTYRRHTGHRQKYTTVQITSISIPGLEIVKKEETAAPKAAE